MLTEPWKHLKSGTDVRGVALPGVEGEEVELKDEVIQKIGEAFFLFLRKKSGKEHLSVALGRDSRLSGPHILSLLEETLSRKGVKVYSAGLSSTPAMFLATLDLPCDGSIQVTASHHPWNRNGLKFFLPSGGLEGEDVKEILTYCQEGARVPDAPGGSVEKVSYMDTYAGRLRKIIKDGMGVEKEPLRGFSVAVDAGNGAGGFYVKDVLEPLGANCAGSRFLEPDGAFPNHIPNPENREAMGFACRAVKESGADLGIIFDTDVDRAGCVDPDGREINRNRLVALASVIALRGNEGGCVVTDSITSSGLKVFLEKDLGAKHLRYRRGYRNVINKAKEMNDLGINTPLAIETSGHAAFRDNYFLDDGAYLATLILIEAAKRKKEGGKIGDLIAKLAEPKESFELRFAIRDEDFRAAGERVLQNLERYGKKAGWIFAEDSFEGVRFSFPRGEGDGWLLLRLSVHDPVMPLNLESDSLGGCLVIARALLDALKGEKALDITPLEEFLA